MGRYQPKPQDFTIAEALTIPVKRQEAVAEAEDSGGCGRCRVAVVHEEAE